MGLRINHNISALAALRQLGIADGQQKTSLERLSTGLRINRASDDPSGLVISESLRSQVESLKQAKQNSQFAANLIGTAEAALNEVASLLVKVRSSVIFALNSGGATLGQIQAEQNSVDQALSAIDRIAVTTRFGSKALLDGSSSFIIQSRMQGQKANTTAGMDYVNVQRVQFGNAQSANDFGFYITQEASRAILTAITGTTSTASVVSGPGGASGIATVRVSGQLGTKDITLASGASLADLRTAVNQVSSETGVFLSGDGSNFYFLSTQFGSDQTITVENLTASTGSAWVVRLFGAAAAGRVALNEQKSDTGQDVKVNVAQTPITGNGWKLNVNISSLTAEMLFSQTSEKGASGNLFTVVSPLSNRNSGLAFQLNGSASAIDRVTLGITSISSANLGSSVTLENQLVTTAAANTSVLSGGFLTSLRTGSTNDLLTNPNNALKIIDDAIAQVSSTRAFLGSMQADTIDPNIDSLGVAIENLTATESEIRDLDFAEETSQFTRTQILFQAATAVLASANLVPQAVLTLIQ
jgi:flagellin